MMIKLNNFSFFKNIFVNCLYALTFILLCFYQKNAFSQNNNLQKKLSSNMVGTNIKVSELSKPSLGSLGVNTKANDFLGINIWGNMNAKDVKNVSTGSFDILEVGGRVFDPFGLTNVVSAFEPDDNLDLMPNDSSVVTIIDFNYETDANGDLMPRASSLI